MSNYISDILFRRIYSPPSAGLTSVQITAIAAQVPPTDISSKVDKVSGSALLATTEAAKIHGVGSDNQDLSGLQATSAKGAANGYAPLDASSKVPIANLPDDKVSSVNGSQGAVVLTPDNLDDTSSTHKFVLAADITKLGNLSGTNSGDSAGHTGLVATTVTVNAKALSSNIVLTPDDLDDAATTHKFATGANTGDETAARIAAINHAASAKTALVDADEITGQDSAATFGLIRTTWTNVKAFLKTYFDGLYNPKRLFTNLAAAVVTSGTTEKVLIQLAVPAARAVVGSTFRAWVVGNSSSTGTLIFKVRCGAGGVITDAIGWTATTSAAQAANARAGFEVLITVRSATTLYTDGVAYAGAVQLPTVIAAAAPSAITISGVWYINLTVICSSGTFTAQVASVEEIR